MLCVSGWYISYLTYVVDSSKFLISILKIIKFCESDILYFDFNLNSQRPKSTFEISLLSDLSWSSIADTSKITFSVLIMVWLLFIKFSFIWEYTSIIWLLLISPPHILLIISSNLQTSPCVCFSLFSFFILVSLIFSFLSISSVCLSVSSVGVSVSSVGASVSSVGVSVSSVCLSVSSVGSSVSSVGASVSSVGVSVSSVGASVYVFSVVTLLSVRVVVSSTSKGLSSHTILDSS